MSSGLYSGASGIALGVGLYRQVAGLWGGASGLVSGFGNPIPPLFASGSPGAWFDFTDTSTWYQDAARTTPAATLGDVVGLVLDKSRGLALGPELVTNGDFASSAGWTTGSGWSIGGGVATHASGTANADLSSTIGSVVVGGLYKVTIDVTWTSGSEVRVIFGNVAKGFTASGSYTFYHTPTTTGDGSLRIRAVGGAEIASIDNISVKLLAGNHASQATTAQKPLRARIPFGGRRNMLTYTEDFSNAAWAKYNQGAGSVPTLTANAGTDPNGTNTATRVQLNCGGATANDRSNLSYPLSSFANSTVYCGSVYVKAYSGGEVGKQLRLYGDALFPNLIVTLTADWQRLPITGTSSSTSGAFGLETRGTYTTNQTADFLMWAPQLEKGSSATAYQKVVADWDVTEAGVTSIPALYFDGSDDSLATAAIDFATCTSDGAARRNVVNFPKTFRSAWLDFSAGTTTVTQGYGVAPDGTTTAVRLQGNNANTWWSSNYLTSAWASTTGTASIYLKSNSGTPTISLKLSFNAGATYSQNITLTNEWVRYTFTQLFGAGDTQTLAFSISHGNGNDISAWGAQLEAGSTATAFQDIGTDKMTVFAGVEKLSDAVLGFLVELSAGVSSNNGSFSVRAPGSAGPTYLTEAKGTVQSNVLTSSTYVSPVTNNLTLLIDISGDAHTLRLNGAVAGSAATDLGTGNFGSYALYLGRRGGTAFPFKGYMIGHLVIVGKLANASEIAAVEATERAATGAY